MLLTSPGVTHVGVAFDHVIESFRNDLYTGYKTSEGVDPNLLAQFPLAEEVTMPLPFQFPTGVRPDWIRPVTPV